MQHFEHFHREAVKHNLSAGAILLWQQLYFTMERKNQFADLQQSTAVLTAQLQITRQGLAVMRQTLIDRGFLTVRVDEHQQTFYTLMIEGKIVGAGFPRPQSATGTNDSYAMPVGEGSPFPQNMDMAQSVKRRWKGFFALKVKAKPSGEALRQQEETHQPRPKPWDKPAIWQKCRPEGRDLSFLEI